MQCENEDSSRTFILANLVPEHNRLMLIRHAAYTMISLLVIRLLQEFCQASRVACAVYPTLLGI
jgi:hypothetical protein